MDLVEARRLTGPNLYDRRPGAVAEVRFSSSDVVEPALACWREVSENALARLGWTATRHWRRFGDAQGQPGAELMITAPRDRLYATVALLEWTIARAAGLLHLHDPIGDEPLEQVVALAANEARERAGALELIEQAEREGVAWLIDDECFSLGHGSRCRTWPLPRAIDDPLPAPDTLDWTSFGRPLPTVLITGTNGKTTSARLLTRIAKLAGHRVGNTSTDGVFVDEQLIEQGDWTGPGGARLLLRRPDVDFAVLEVARGGMLRRGLGVTSANAALITNVSHDHLGEYGVHDLDALARVKAIVTSVVGRGGRIVLGADSSPLVAWADMRPFPAPVVWFSPDVDHPVLRAHRSAGGEVCTVVDARICYCRGWGIEPLIPVNEIPLTFAGRAKHNIANVLGVVALARALGFPDMATVTALRQFGSDLKDNPGRARAWTVPLPGGGSFDLLLDFAHNQAGLAAMAELVNSYRRSVIVSFGIAGDRRDEDVRALGQALLRFEPSHVILREQEDYLRGRERGVVPPLLGEGVTRAGYPASQVSYVDNEPQALDRARELARAGELVVLLVHTDYEGVGKWLAEVGARPTSLA